MPAKVVKLKRDASAAMTVTVVAATTSRQTTLVSNTNNRPGALIYVKIRSNATTTPGPSAWWTVWLIRSDGVIADAGAGLTDAAIVPENMIPLGIIRATSDTGKYFYGTFDTAPAGPLPSTWGIVISQSTANFYNDSTMHAVRYEYYYWEEQQ